MRQLPDELYTAAQTRELDRIAIEQHNLPAATLMARAGAAALTAIQYYWPEAKKLAIVCGGGNNGGDGYELARQALENGYQARVYELGHIDKMSNETLAARNALINAGGDTQCFDGQLTGSEILIDGLFGTGLDREVTGLYAQAIQTINNCRNTPVLSLDIPSGIHADTGQALGCAVEANVTISFIGLNVGLFNGEGPDYCGEVCFDNLGLPASVYEELKPLALKLNYENDAATHLQPRPRTAHKGMFGHLLVVGGDHGMSGAARVAAEAGARVGAGLTSIATRQLHAAHLNLSRPEVMCHAIESSETLEPLLNAATSLTLGPGLGQSSWSQTVFEKAIQANLTMVVDADGLNLLSQSPRTNNNWVLTPHPGEAARLLGVSTKQVQADRFAAVQQLQQKYGGVVVLKGAGTLVYDGKQPVWLSSLGNPGMASGGMGDALAGIIGGLAAQKLSLVDAAKVGVLLHAMAADKAAEQDGERGMLAMDLMPHLRHLANLRY